MTQKESQIENTKIDNERCPRRNTDIEKETQNEISCTSEFISKDGQNWAILIALLNTAVK